MSQVRELHEHDQNFPTAALDKIKYFLDEPEVESNPDKHAELIHEMKLEALLVTENSPYAEVRAVVDNWDDPTLPVFTIRTWVIGVVLAAVGAFINQLFFIRYPAVSISANVAQLIAREPQLSRTHHPVADRQCLLVACSRGSCPISASGCSDGSTRSTPAGSTRKSTCSSPSWPTALTTRLTPATPSSLRRFPSTLARRTPSTSATRVGNCSVVLPDRG